MDAITAGESIAVVLNELVGEVKKFGWCDNMAALGNPLQRGRKLENEAPSISKCFHKAVGVER